MLLAAETVQWFAVGGLAVGAVGLVAGVGASVRLGRLRRAYAHVRGAAESGTLLAQLSDQRAELTALRGHGSRLGAEVAGVRGDLAEAVRRVAVVRYDAFSDMGGRLSFSLALLDDAGDGVVLTSINGRSETRSYAKGISAARSDAALSPEEEQAIGIAMRAAPARTS